MSVVKIGTSSYVDSLEERLFFELEFLRQDGIVINIDKIDKKDTVIFRCEHNDEEEENSLNIFKEYIGNALSDVIINSLEDNLLRKTLTKDYKHFSPEEQERILELAYERLNFLVSEDNEEVISKIQRKNRILLEIVDYLDAKNEIFLEGFVRFRLKNYLAELELAVEGAVEDFTVEEEYREFIYLLKSFVDEQIPKNKVVNVIKTSDGNFQLLNREGMILENVFLDEYLLKMGAEGLNDKDLLISSLITVAPEDIILHFKEPISMVKTLEEVFTDRISICLGCQYCEINDVNELE